MIIFTISYYYYYYYYYLLLLLLLLLLLPYYYYYYYYYYPTTTTTATATFRDHNLPLFSCAPSPSESFAEPKPGLLHPKTMTMGVSHHQLSQALLQKGPTEVVNPS